VGGRGGGITGGRVLQFTALIETEVGLIERFGGQKKSL